jgi:hypothetical protein
MQLCWRRVGSGETDWELLWLTVSVGGLAAATIWFALNLPWPRCLFLAITGHPCVTCGATRSAIEFFHGHLAAAWKWNPLVLGFLCAVSIFDVYAFTVLTLRLPRLRIAHLTQAEKNAAWSLIVALLVANWIWVLWHWPKM